MMGNTETVAGGSLPVQRIRCRLPSGCQNIIKEFGGRVKDPARHRVISDQDGDGCERRLMRAKAEANGGEIEVES